MHCNRRDFGVWMSHLCSKCPLTGFHKIQTEEIKCIQFSPSPCLFAEPEAVSKHSVSLWIGYSDDMRPKRKIGVFPLTRPTLFWGADPKLFLVAKIRFSHVILWWLFRVTKTLYWSTVESSVLGSFVYNIQAFTKQWCDLSWEKVSICPSGGDREMWPPRET